MDLEIDNSYNICFMSDKQKGLMEAVFVLFPNVEARNCAKHLYNNFKNMEGFRGQAMYLTYWKAAKVTFPRQFEEAMFEMRSLLESAKAWLCEKDPRTWSRAYFSTRCKSDLLLNKNSECFNKDLLSLQIILETRDKPILTMLEIIRRKVMIRLVSMKEVVEKYPGPLCPMIQKKVFEIVSQSTKGPMQWEHVRDMEPILPPMIRRPRGRPKQTMRKEVDKARESGPKLSKIGQQANCTKCGKPDYNTRTWVQKLEYLSNEIFEALALAMVTMRPTPLGLIMEKLSLSFKRYESGRKFYIQTLDDRALSPDV
ncbi:hypothetical protein J1N35_034901 [Gossypium stocksii]|uniref:MULE transposase domain-containing protein n=1 Tax=Gossypium stocksii TaxID=47602 RepID=A0A9D3USW8_9ROSI|nr:hypothetical protein J1N35_034901 [Gossypium stocksii]